jgi:hypothetical protein
MKNVKQFRELANTAVAVGFVAILAFLVVSTALVLSWDWVAVPMFGAPFAPFQAGMGITLLISLVVGVAEVMKDRK